MAYRFFRRSNIFLAFLKDTKLRLIPENHIIKDAANGKAALWHGYTARLGFGITRIKNQTSAEKPSNGRAFHIHLRTCPVI